MRDLHQLGQRMCGLDERLRPIGQRPVDIHKPGWAEALRHRPQPLDEAGVRGQAETLLAELADSYADGTEIQQDEIRGFFASCPSFAWAAALPFEPDTAEHLRQHLILFSMQDQGRDSRDAILQLQALCRTAKAASVGLGPALREVAAMSSVSNRFGMGSTRDMLLRAAGEDPLTRNERGR
jgi:hypothetical protein